MLGLPDCDHCAVCGALIGEEGGEVWWLLVRDCPTAFRMGRNAHRLRGRRRERAIYDLVIHNHKCPNHAHLHTCHGHTLEGFEGVYEKRDPYGFSWSYVDPSITTVV